MTVIEAPKPVVRGPQVWPLGLKAYHALGDLGLIPEKTELLYGQIFQKMPKSPFHRLLLMRLLELLQRILPPGLHVQPDQPILCGDSELEPDLSVIRGSINDYLTEHPRTAELVIEICVSSHDYDRSKLGAYAVAGVKECWLVLAPEKQIEVHRQPQGEQFAERALQGPGGSLNSATIPSFTVELDRLFTTWKAIERPAAKPLVPQANAKKEPGLAWAMGCGFPGLQLPVAPLLAGDTAKVLATLTVFEPLNRKPPETSVKSDTG